MRVSALTACCYIVKHSSQWVLGDHAFGFHFLAKNGITVYSKKTPVRKLDREPALQVSSCSTDLFYQQDLTVASEIYK